MLRQLINGASVAIRFYLELNVYVGFRIIAEK